MATTLALVWLYIALRLVSYRRDGARYRRLVGWAAYVLMVGAFARAVAIGIDHAPAHWSEAIVAVALAALVWRSRGNVAGLLRGRCA